MNVERAASAFAIEGTFVRAERIGDGHIHETYTLDYAVRGGAARYIIQRINTHVFPDVPSVMQNIARIAAHLKERSLSLVRTRDAAVFYVDDDAQCWRVYRYIEGTHLSTRSASVGDAYLAAKAFGEFTRALGDLPGEPLHETLPGFHDTELRFKNFISALERDAHNRADSVRDLIGLAQRDEPVARVLRLLHEGARLRKLVVHNDTKINNVILARGERAFVIDLDTAMVGYPLHDVGDLLRTGAAAADEDETDLSRVGVRADYALAISQGYCEGLGDLLEPVEREHFTTAARALCYETGLRFLTDYLEGDCYFRIAHPNHNVARARNQFALMRAFEE